MAHIARMLNANATFHHDVDAVVAPQGSRTWGELRASAADVAGGLIARGLQPGDRVALVSDNAPEILEAYYAAAGSGLVVCPATTRTHPAELDRYFGEYLQPRAAVLGPGSAATLGGWTERCELLVRLPGGPAAVGCDWAQLEGPPVLRDDVDPGAAFTIGQTSGTSGQPKGAVITQANAAAGLFSYIAELPIAAGDTYLIQHPMSNVPGGPGQLFALPKAARTAVLDRFDPERCCRAIEEWGVTHTVLVPAMLRALLDHPGLGDADLSSLRAVTVGASPVPSSLLRRAVDVLGDVFVPMYGMTESTSVACTLRGRDLYPVDAQPESRFRSAGSPSAGVELRVVDDDGHDIPFDGAAVGEILLRGSNVVSGYWADVPENETSWSGEWFRTGDAANVDAAGYVTIVDRIKDVIITGGVNVASREVEEVLLEHPDVADIAVIGVPDPQWGEAVTAVVVCAEQEPDPAALIEHCRGRLGGPKIPKAVHTVDALPRNAMGKVLKRELRAWLADGDVE